VRGKTRRNEKAMSNVPYFSKKRERETKKKREACGRSRRREVCCESPRAAAVSKDDALLRHVATLQSDEGRRQGAGV
jgi:hypothetical protein